MKRFPVVICASGGVRFSTRMSLMRPGDRIEFVLSDAEAFLISSAESAKRDFRRKIALAFKAMMDERFPPDRFEAVPFCDPYATIEWESS